MTALAFMVDLIAMSLAAIGALIVVFAVLTMLFGAANVIEREWQRYRLKRDYEPVIEKWDRVLVETWRRRR